MSALVDQAETDRRVTVPWIKLPGGMIKWPPSSSGEIAVVVKAVPAGEP